MDMAKLAISSVASYAAGVLLTTTAVVGGSIIAVALIVFFVGFLVVAGLDIIDEHFGISTKLIALLKEKMKVKPRTPEANFQYILNGLRG